MTPTASPKRAWVTLLTRTSYLAGAVLLAHSLRKHQSVYPLIVLYTPTLPTPCLQALQQEAALTNIILRPVDLLLPKEKVSLIASRFEDTWTKLRVFSLYEYDRLVFLDADMLLLRNMDELFELQLPSENWIAANHACVCNLDKDDWAPEDWTKENCAYTRLTPASPPCPVPAEGKGPRTHTLLNSGLFIFQPFREQWEAMLDFLNTSPLIKTFMFPDQDFLAEFFRGRWISVGYQYNALKTMRYWHPEMWQDSEVRNLHYIVDKPWSRRVGPDGKAGYLGRDGETHKWWWEAYDEWERARRAADQSDILALVGQNVARKVKDGEEAEELHGNWQANPSREA